MPPSAPASEAALKKRAIRKTLSLRVYLDGVSLTVLHVEDRSRSRGAVRVFSPSANFKEMNMPHREVKDDAGEEA